MKPIAVRVMFRNGSVEDAVAWPATQVAFERRFDVPFMASFRSEPALRVEWLMFIGWHAFGASGEFDEWIKDVATVSIGTVELAAPTAEA